MADAGVSLACGRSFSRVRDFHASIVFRCRILERSFLVGRVRGDFSCGKTNCGSGRGKWSSVVVGHLSQRRDDAVRVGVGYVAFCVAGRDDFVGDAGTGGIATAARLVRLWAALGFYAHDQPGAGFVAAVSIGMGGVPRVARIQLVLDEADAGRSGDRRFVLRAMDGAELRRVSPADSAAVEFPARAVYRKQRKLCAARGVPT